MKPMLPNGLQHVPARIRLGVRQAAPALALAALASCSPPPSGPPTTAQTQAFLSQANTLVQAMQACDQAATHAASPNGVTSYDGSLNAQAECSKTANTVVNFRFGAEIGQQFQQPLDDALGPCWAAYDAKARGLTALAMAADAVTASQAGPRPDFDQINSQTRACMAGLQQKANSLGFKADIAAGEGRSAAG